jgi:pimeloyl-ACP methyl ester carboxylesterase
VTAPEQLTIEASGMTFGALAWGDSTAPLALLVHGYPDSAWTWRHLGPLLADRGWRAVAPFTRGYAPSDLAPNDSYLINDQIGDILALQTALGDDARSVLIGHDWGAVATWGVTAVEPSRFDRYVTLAVPPTAALLKAFTSLKTLPIALRQARMSWYIFYNQLPASERGLDRVIPKLWRDWSPGYDAHEDIAHVFAALSGPGRRRAALRYYRDTLRGGPRGTSTAEPGAPALYLHGAQDGCMQAAIGGLFPEVFAAGSTVEIVPGVGHFLHLEDPVGVGGLIADYLGTPD